MEVVTYWSGIVVGVLGSLYGFAVVASARRPAEGAEARRPSVTWLIGVAAVFVLVPFLLTIPSGRPFATGMRLGIGLLIGSAFAVVAGVLAPALSGGPLRERPLGERRRAWIMAVSGYLGLASWALLGVNLTLLLFRGDPNDVLIGFALGCCVVGLVLRVGGAVLGADRWRPLEAFVVFAVTLCAAVCIAIHHFVLVEQRIWWALPLLLASIGIAAAVVGSRFADVVAGQRRGTAVTLALLLSAALVAVLAYALSLKVFPPGTTFWVILCGLGAALAIVWLLAAARPAVSASRRTLVAGSVQAACVCATLIVLATVVSFKLLAGYGVGLALVAAWAVGFIAIAPVPASEEDEATQGESAGTESGLGACLTIGLLMLLVRLFLERNPEAPRSELGIHYVFVGLMVGVLLPMLFAAFNLRTAERAARLLENDGEGAASRSVIGRLEVMVAFCLVAPLLVLFMWGFKAAVGLLTGLVACQVILTVLYQWQWADDEGDSLLLPGLGIVSVTLALVAIQLSHLVGPLVVAERVYKLYTIGAILLLGALWLAIDGWRSIRESRAEG
jgi:hypothetical protein